MKMSTRALTSSITATRELEDDFVLNPVVIRNPSSCSSRAHNGASRRIHRDLLLSTSRKREDIRLRKP